MDYALLVERFRRSHRNHRWSGQRLLHECLRAAIRDGTLAAGARMPSSRVLAAELGVARNSALYAYEQLATEGFVLPDRRGTVVARLKGTAHAGGGAAVRHSLSRRALEVRTEPAMTLAAGFAPGVPALDEFPIVLWRRLLERAWRQLPPAQLNYGDPAGMPQLRAAIADHLRAARGAQCHAGQVIITDGTQASLDLIARAFADVGDKVWIESPGYGGALGAFRAAQLRPVGIALDAQGICPAAADWERHRPKLIYVTPSHQYPTGTVLSPERRMDLIDGARRVGALIVEDDYDSEFRHDGPPLSAMQGLAPDAPVLYLGTFSKTMFPALRIGFMVVPDSLAEPMQALLTRTTVRGRSAEQLALAEFLNSGQFARHLRRMRRLYRERRDALVTALEAHCADIGIVHGGSAGMHLALRLHDERLDDRAIAVRALEQGVVVQSISAQVIGPRAARWSGFLLGYAQVPAERIDGLVRKLAAVVRAEIKGVRP
jgi:GntR family transcriptional regulator/MocR family aminotransferase